MLRLSSAGAKTSSRLRGGLAGLLLAVTVALLGACTAPPPVAIAATGDSIARGFDACTAWHDCPTVSYATGSAPSSDSVYRHLIPVSAGIAGHSYNDAQVGARAEDLYYQIAIAAWQKADVVTVLIGANDVCAPTLAQMTPVPEFSAFIDDAFRYYFSQRPGGRIVLSSIPDLYHLWQIAHTDPKAQAIWKMAGICPSMLANPTSTGGPDSLRRYFVSLQIGKYDDALAAVCRRYTGCKWDGGAVTRYQFSMSELSTYDYFHPNAAGHRALSALAWKTYSS